MMARLRRTAASVVAVVAVVALLAGGAYLLVTTRSQLGSDRDRVDARWSTLSPALAARYEHLGTLVTAFDGAGARDRAVTTALRDGIARWDAAYRGGRPEASLVAANDLEGLAARAKAVVAGSRRLQGVTPVTEALTAVDASTPPLAAVAAYNDAVKRYEDHRGATLRAAIAPRLGFERRDTFQPVAPA